MGVTIMRLSLPIVSLIAAFALSGAFAQTQPAAQAGASGQSQGSVSTGKSGASAAGSAAAAGEVQGHSAQAAVASGSEVNAALSKPVDADKAKPGDEVTAVTAEDLKSNGQVMVPRGSKLVGHVTSAKPHGGSKAPSSGEGSAGAAGAAAASADSELGIVFDHAVLRDGREIPLHATIQAVAASEAAASGGLSQGEMMASGGGAGAMGAGRGVGGGLIGGAGGAVRGAAGATAGLGATAGSSLGGTTSLMGSAGAVGGLSSMGRFRPGSRGAFGMRDLDVSSAASGSGGASLVTSQARTVRLDKGTRMLLVTGASGGASAAGGAGASMGKTQPSKDASGKPKEDSREPPDRR